MSTLNRLLQNLDDAQVKIASDTAQPPQEGHPTDHIDDHVGVPVGDTVTTAADDQIDRLGPLAAGSTSAPTNDKEKKIPTMQTEVLDGTSSPAELTPGEGLEDPGPDSSHPASPNSNGKYASMKSAQEILASMNKKADFTRGQLTTAVTTGAEVRKTEAAKVAGQPQTPAATEGEGINKFAAALNAVITPDKRDAALKTAAATLEPLVAYGVEMANKVANFMAAAEQDPAAAAAMMGGDPTAGGDPMAGAGGGDPMAGAMGGGAMGGDPAAAGAGGGGDLQAMLDELMTKIEQFAQMAGTDPTTLMLTLAGQGGGGAGGAPPAGGGGGAGGAPPDAGASAPPSASPGDSAPKDSSSSEGGSSAKSEEKEESKEESKEAGAPNRKKVLRKEAYALLNEILDEND